MTQTQKVLDYIDRFNSITPLQAFADLGIMRLAARISDLKKMGVDIASEMVKDLNRFGEPVHYTRYRRA